MVWLGNKQRSFCNFEIASKYCISDSFVDHNGYSISSKGFLPTVVDIRRLKIYLPSLHAHSAIWNEEDVFLVKVLIYNVVLVSERRLLDEKNFSVKYRAEISHLIEAVENPKQTQLTTILDIEYRLANLKLVSSLFSWIAQYKNFLAGGFHLLIITLFFSVVLIYAIFCIVLHCFPCCCKTVTKSFWSKKETWNTLVQFFLKIEKHVKF